MMNSQPTPIRDSARRSQLAEHIAMQLEKNSAALQVAFAASVQEVGVRYCFLDDLLPAGTAAGIHAAFPAPQQMRLLDSFREKKYTTKSLELFDPILADITFAVQSPAVLALVEKITGIRKQTPDSLLYAGGLSAMTQGHFLSPHIDNSHDAAGKLYRTLNLLYYVTPDWSLESGGNLELWDRAVKRYTTIVSRFNRLAIMETNPWSWHSVSPVRVERFRCCVSNYYFSECSPTGVDYSNVTSFSARPEQRVRRAVAWLDNKMREFVRVFAPGGVGKKDFYGRSQQ